jgi:glutaredoxin
MAQFISNGIMSATRVLDAQQVMESKGCPHCDKLRSFLERRGSPGYANGDLEEPIRTHMNGELHSEVEEAQIGRDETDLETIPENGKTSLLTATVSRQH